MYLSLVATYDVIIIGGGLAGLTAAIHLRKYNHRILLLEKETYPNHKVCGEYLSNEVVPYLHQLGVILPTTIEISTLQFSTKKGRSLQLSLPLGALGISRYALDHCLYQRAKDLGVSIVFCSVEHIAFKQDVFTVKTNTDQSYKAPITIGAFGKRSNLDKMLSRNFIAKKSPWLGVKAHYAYDDFPDDLVGLHSFEGGYGGLSKTESGAVNFCYLATYESFQKKQNIEDFNTLIVAQNPYLANFLKKAIIKFDRPLTIAQISFEEKEPVEDHVIMCGDSAGLIHPLCGNGMAMAIHSAKIASELIHAYLKEASSDRNRLEKEYALKWQRTFGKRIRTGRRLQKLLMSPKVADILFSLAVLSPGILRRIIKRTHGKPIEL